MTMAKFTKNCPTCNEEIVYKDKRTFSRSMKLNSKCKKCGYKKNSLSNDIVQKIIDLNTEKKSNSEVARVLDIDQRTVSRVLKLNDRRSPIINKAIDLVSDTEARCSNCSKIQSIDEFQFGRRGTRDEYKYSYCNECRKDKIIIKLNGDVEKFLEHRFKSVKARCKKRNILFSISKEEFIEQYHKQRGLCFYSNEKMVCEYKRGGVLRDSLSLDKIIPQLGYISGNFVFAINRFNLCKNDLTLEEIKKWIPKWYEKIVEHFKKCGGFDEWIR